MTEDFWIDGQTIQYLMSSETALHTTIVMIVAVHYRQHTVCLQGWLELLRINEVTCTPRLPRNAQGHISQEPMFDIKQQKRKEKHRGR